MRSKKYFFSEKRVPSKMEKTFGRKKMAREKKKFHRPFFFRPNFFSIFEGTPFWKNIFNNQPNLAIPHPYPFMCPSRESAPDSTPKGTPKGTPQGPVASCEGSCENAHESPCRSC